MQTRVSQVKIAAEGENSGETNNEDGFDVISWSEYVVNCGPDLHSTEVSSVAQASMILMIMGSCIH